MFRTWLLVKLYNRQLIEGEDRRRSEQESRRVMRSQFLILGRQG